MMKEIVSHTNEVVKALRALKSRRDRVEQGRYLIEGLKCIEEAFAAGAQVLCVVTSHKESDAVALAKRHGVEVLLVPRSIIEQISDTKTPPNDLACVALHHQSIPKDGKFFVALDDVNDPKNVGTIIRTADAMGADGVLISQTSADYFGPKAQRAAMGSGFHIPVEVCDLHTRLHVMKQHGVRLVAGSLQGGETLPQGLGKACVIIGNESRGISAPLLELADVQYKIKMYGRAESLNASVAAGILLYEVRRVLD